MATGHTRRRVGQFRTISRSTSRVTSSSGVTPMRRSPRRTTPSSSTGWSRDTKAPLPRDPLRRRSLWRVFSMASRMPCAHPHVSSASLLSRRMTPYGIVKIVTTVFILIALRNGQKTPSSSRKIWSRRIPVKQKRTLDGRVLNVDMNTFRIIFPETISVTAKRFGIPSLMPGTPPTVAESFVTYPWVGIADTDAVFSVILASISMQKEQQNNKNLLLGPCPPCPQTVSVSCHCTRSKPTVR